MQLTAHIVWYSHAALRECKFKETIQMLTPGYYSFCE
jgi:hypothetical protein